MTAAGPRPDEPMGPGGQRLHEWAFAGDEQDRSVLTDGGATTGAIIAGRRTYDTSVPWWGADGPTGQVRLPVIVVSHGQPPEMPANGVYTFVDGIEPALTAAKQAAGDKDVTVMGGAEIGIQYLRANLIDELSLHIVPVLFRLRHQDARRGHRLAPPVGAALSHPDDEGDPSAGAHRTQLGLGCRA